MARHPATEEIDVGYGYIGLGEMGSAMCARLLDCGEAVTVFDVDSAAVDRQVAAGATAARSAAEVAGCSDVVSICVPADEHVHAVLTGPDGVVEAARDGLTVLIHSTVRPQTVRDLYWWGRERGIAVHDCCVTGGESAARAGELALFVSDADTLSERTRALLRCYGSLVIPTGGPGSGAAVKVAHNVLTFAMQAAVHAALELVEVEGVARDPLLRAWRHNQQLSPIIERFLTLFDLGPEARSGMRDYLAKVVAIEQKDLALALELGARTPRGPSPVVAAVSEQLPMVFGVAPTG